MSKLTIFHSAPYKEEALPIQGKSERFISFDELKSWIRSGKIFVHLFRYRESRLAVYDLRLLSKPFLLAFILKALSRKQSFINDKEGRNQKITFRFLALSFFKMIRDYFKKNRLLKETFKEIKALAIRSRNSEIVISNPPLYLRTDFCFGLEAGGSVGHIAGVLNHLDHFTGKPIFLTTDQIPTVSPEWESHTIAPGKNFWDFSEVPPIHYNQIFFCEAIQRIGTRIPSFIYQRYSLNNFAGVKLANHYRVPLVLEFNGSEIWVSRYWGNRLKFEALSEQIENANLRAADLIVVISQPLKNELLAKGISQKKILVNPNGVNPDRYSPSIDGSLIRKKFQLEDKIVFGFIGTFGKWHGAEILVEAFGRFLQEWPEYREKTRLFLIGNGLTLQQTQKLVSELNLSSHCIFTGTVPQKEGPFYLAACDILISPQVPNADGTPFFGSPTKIFEYMAMGKGIIASDLDQIGEILEHNRSAWLVKPGHAHSLAIGMKALADDPLLRKRLAQTARNDAVTRHTWKEHTRKIIDQLLSLKQEI